MFSTTISSASTETCKTKSCEVIPPIRPKHSASRFVPRYHTLDDILPQKLCLDHFNRHHAPRYKEPKETIERRCVLCEKYVGKLEKSIQDWGTKYLDNTCYSVDHTRPKNLKRKKRIEKVANKFQQSHAPWYIPIKEDDPVPAYKRFYAYPKIAVQLEYGFNDYRRIIEFARKLNFRFEEEKTSGIISIPILDHGICIFIVNLQYGSQSKHKRTFKSIEKAIQKIEQNAYMDTEIVVIAEITDPKLRTGLLKNNSPGVYLDRDSRIILTSNRRFSHKGSHEIVYVNFANFVPSMNLKDIIKIGDEIQVEVVEKLVSSLICCVKTSGLLKPCMDVRVPEMNSQVGKYISPEEDEDIRFILQYDFCDFISCPCAHKISACQYIRWFMATHSKRMFILGRIVPDKYADEEVIKKIVQEFSGIWIDKKDIAAPTEIENLIVNRCKAEGKPIIRSAYYIKDQHLKLPKDKLASRNLLLYPDCLVVKSCLPNAITPLDVRSIIRRSYPEMNDESLEYCCSFIPLQTGAPHIFIRQTALSVLFEKASCVIMVNNTGRSAMLLSQNRIGVPIIASVRDETIARRLLVWKNVIPILYYENLYCDWNEELDDRISFSVDHARRNGYINSKDIYIICFDSLRGLKFADTFRLATVTCWEDFDENSL